MDEDAGTTRVGAAVRSARLYRGLSLEVVAGLAGHSKSWLSKVERGLLPLERRSDIAALADALQVSPADLTGRPFLGDKRPERVADTAVVQVRKALQDLPDPEQADEPDRLVAEAEAMQPLRLSLDLAGLGQVLPGLLARLRATLAAVRRAEDRARLLRAYFWTAHAAMGRTKNLGYLDLAWIAADHTRVAAEGLDDPVWLAAAEFTRAHALIPTGAVSAASRYASAGADAASVAAGPDAAGVHGALQLVGAYAVAIAGRTEEAADRVAAAERLAAGDAGRVFTRGFSFGAPNVALHRMQVAVESGQPQQVLTAASQMPDEALPTPERRASHVLGGPGPGARDDAPRRGGASDAAPGGGDRTCAGSAAPDSARGAGGHTGPAAAGHRRPGVAGPAVPDGPTALTDPRVSTETQQRRGFPAATVRPARSVAVGPGVGPLRRLGWQPPDALPGDRPPMPRGRRGKPGCRAGTPHLNRPSAPGAQRVPTSAAVRERPGQPTYRRPGRRQPARRRLGSSRR